MLSLFDDLIKPHCLKVTRPYIKFILEGNQQSESTTGALEESIVKMLCEPEPNAVWFEFTFEFNTWIFFR